MTPTRSAAVDPQPTLTTGYPAEGTDALVPADLLAAEVRQRRETGYDVDHIVRRANDTDPADRSAVMALLDLMGQSERTQEWTYDEPDALVDIHASLPQVPVARAVDLATVRDRIHAAWLGRIAGCNLGKPIEMGPHWTVERIRDYLKVAGAYPLRDYVPVLEPMPDRFTLRDCWNETTRGHVAGSARDDDIDYTILALHLLETHGSELTPDHVGTAWLELFPLTQVYTAERAVYINLATGVPASQAAASRNPFREWIGAQIRGDMFGFVHPGDPWSAAASSFQDASLSHRGNGIYGEMWAAALVSAAFVADDAREALATSLQVIPPRSRLFEALNAVITMFDSGLEWAAALHTIRQTYGHYSWVHTINNAAVVAAGLLWSRGDYTTAVGQTVMSGWDTDSNGATVGSVAAILTGTAHLPAHLIEPLEDRTRSALFGFDHVSISSLADRTFTLASGGLTRTDPVRR